MLVLYRDRLIENRTHGKHDNAYNQPTRSNHGTPFFWLQSVYPSSAEPNHLAGALRTDFFLCLERCLMVPWKEGISGHASYAIHLVWQKMCSEQPLAAELPGPRWLGQQTRTTLGAPLRTGGRRRGTRLWSKSDGTRPLSVRRPPVGEDGRQRPPWSRAPAGPPHAGAGLPIKGAAYAHRVIVTGGGALFLYPSGPPKNHPIG